MYYGIKVKLKKDYNITQAFLKACDSTRVIYNQALAYRIENKQATPSSFIAETKANEPWLFEVGDSLDYSIMNLNNAYARLFKGTSKFPNFKSRKRAKYSFTFTAGPLHVSANSINIPNIGAIKFYDRKKKQYVSNSLGIIT